MPSFLPKTVAHAAAGAVALASALLGGEAHAQRLHLPNAVADACPGCRVIACGSQAMRFGKGYAGTAQLGLPRRGYVIADAIDGPTFRRLTRETANLDRLTRELTERFGRARLIALEGTLRTARILPDPPEVSLRFPEPLYLCLRDPAKSWGCCTGAGCQGECCEKGLGSPEVTLTWRDSVAGETVRLAYSHTAGNSFLTRRGEATTTYWCLTDRLAKLR